MPHGPGFRAVVRQRFVLAEFGLRKHRARDHPGREQQGRGEQPDRHGIPVQGGGVEVTSAMNGRPTARRPVPPPR